MVICILPIYSMTTWPSVYLDSKGTPGEVEDDKSIEKNIINKSGHDTNLNLHYVWSKTPGILTQTLRFCFLNFYRNF